MPVAAVPWAAQVQPVQAVVDVAMEPPPALVKVFDRIRPRFATQAPQSFWLKAWALLNAAWGRDVIRTHAGSTPQEKKEKRRKI